MRCVWVEAYEKSLAMPTYGHEMLQIQPPVNRQLEGTSSWINMLHDVDTALPKGWISTADIPVIKGTAEAGEWRLEMSQSPVSNL